MKITLLTVGTRGDVQPFVALGLALQKAGQRVRIAASEGFQEFVEGFGLEYFQVRGNVAKIIESGLAKDAVGADNPLKFFKSMRGGQLMDLLVRAQHDLDEACQGADAIVYHPGAGVGYFAAQERGIPSILATPFPMTPTGQYPNLLFYDGPRLGSGYNRLTHLFFERGFWMMSQGPLKRYWEERYGRRLRGFPCPFPRQRTADRPTVVSCSPQVFAPPADCSRHVHASGYWFLDPDPGYRPAEELRAFLAAGPAPVYVGFGSVSDKARAAETTQLVMAALRRAGKRGILATGWNVMERPAEQPEDMLFISGAPHDWLFPQVAAAVHHGGAGSTAAALRAGVPSVVVPFGNDQFAWGRRVHELGAGSRAVPRKRLTVDLLAEAVAAAQAPAVREGARALGERIRQETGAADAAAVILSCIGGGERAKGK